jgi:hypothetical protein
VNKGTEDTETRTAMIHLCDNPSRTEGYSWAPPKLGEDGHKRYAAACRSGRIGSLLALWNRELPDRHADLQPHESGCEDDD